MIYLVNCFGYSLNQRCFYGACALAIRDTYKLPAKLILLYETCK